MWDIREGVVGSDTFIPKHVVFLTWKNMSFAGGIDNSLFRVSLLQLLLIESAEATRNSTLHRPTRSKWCWQPMKSTLMPFSITPKSIGPRTRKRVVTRREVKAVCLHM